MNLIVTRLINKKNVKKFFITSFIILGLTSIISQLTVIREMMINFYGNEFFIGWIFFAWLLWVALGSFSAKWLITKGNISKILASSYILVALFLPLEIYLIRLSKIIISQTPGAIPNLMPALLYAFIIISPLCFILGLQFVLANRFWTLSMQDLKISYLLGKSYFYETIGFIIGGLIFNYALIFVDEFKTISILAWLNLLTAFLIIIINKKRFPVFKIIIFIWLAVFAIIFILGKDINIKTRELSFPNQKLIESKNSLYGNISVTKTDNQYNFYENGLFLGPDKEEMFNEYLTQFPLLYHDNPKKVLLIGSGFNGAIAEIAKYQPDKIYYLELDPKLVDVAKKYVSTELQQYLNQTNIINLDARYFLKNTTEKFDVIIVNLPDPSSALISRFYSQDFFKEIKSHLNPQGILSTHLSFSPDYLSPALEKLNASIYKTVKQTFSHLIILPEDANYFIASQDKILDYNPQPLIQRLLEKNIKNNFVTENYIEYRLTNDRVSKVQSSLETDKKVKVNQDEFPASYYYNLVYWTSYFHPKLANLLATFTKLNFFWVIILFVLITIGFLMFTKKSGKNKNILPLAMAVAGFSLMALEIIIIYSFQVFYGNLFYKIGLIITFLMAGMALGTFLANKKIPRIKTNTLIKIHCLIIIFCLFFIISSWYLFKLSPKPSFIIEIFFLILAALIGSIVGFEFPVVNELYLNNIYINQQKNTLNTGAGTQTGIIYGADLVGSCLGASLISIFILPIFGVFQTLILLAIVNILLILLIKYSKV